VVKELDDMFSRFDITCEYERRTDRQTELLWHTPRFAIASNENRNADYNS